MSRWGKNRFWRDLTERLDRQGAGTAFAAVRLDPERDLWVCDHGDLEAPPVLLQGRRLVVDVTDRAYTLYPLGLAGRFRVSVGFEQPAGQAVVPVRLTYGAGHAELVGDGWSTVTRVSTTLPVAEVEIGGGEPATLWVEADGRRTPLEPETWLTPADVPIDEVAARNNSAIPDPRPLPAQRAGILARRTGHRVVLALAADRAGATGAADRWESVRGAEVRTWETVAGRLALTLPDPRLTRQAAYSVHASLFSRSVDEDGHDIFVHGRRDRGYADTAHLHQSYQMHLPALAAGEGRSVREELLAFLRLQRPDGWIERAPRPIAGSSTYVGRYTGAHLLMAVERYLAWTGDRRFFDEVIESRLEPVPRTVRERVARAADDLLRHRYAGLVKPCGWADAWNPDVRAQGQISAAAVIGLRSWANVQRALGDGTAADETGAAADGIAARMRKVLLDPATGIVAEHVFEREVTGGTPDDYYAHTQVWAALAGVTDDRRGLDLVARDCLDHGIAIAPESAFDQAYVAASTDSAADLPLDSTATWLLARWPEVTHLYALAELRHGRPDAALDAVLRQLPETLHSIDPVCAPWYYAEKYLHPGTRPWLCTWAGDPSLIEVLLCGFLGVHPTVEGLVVRPSTPLAWDGAHLEARFRWRGIPVTVRADATVAPGALRLGDTAVPAGSLLPFDLVSTAPEIRVSTRR